MATSAYTAVVREFPPQTRTLPSRFSRCGFRSSSGRGHLRGYGQSNLPASNAVFASTPAGSSVKIAFRGQRFYVQPRGLLRSHVSPLDEISDKFDHRAGCNVWGSRTPTWCRGLTGGLDFAATETSTTSVNISWISGRCPVTVENNVESAGIRCENRCNLRSI